jgi:hypothetical protein
MRRATRILFHLVAVASGVLCLASVGLWIASYSSMHMLKDVQMSSVRDVSVSRGELDFYVESWHGVLLWTRMSDRGWKWTKLPPVDLRESVDAMFQGRRSATAGFFFGTSERSISTQKILLLPIAFPVFVFSLLPLTDLTLMRRRHRRRRRAAAGLCVSCGYDLRATPEKCPECGTVSTTQPARPGGAGG